VRLDGAVYGQPLLVGDLVIAATENDSVYGLDQATGKVAWRTHVGSPVPLADLPCGNIDPLGITGTPVYNPASGLVYAVAETTGFHHVLVGLSVRDGAVRIERDIPTPDGQPRYDQQRPALTIGAGRVYVAFGGLYGDCGPYRGSVVGIPLSGSGPLISYVVARWSLRARRAGNLTASLAALEYREMLRLLEKRGWKKAPSQTPLEFAAAIPSSEISAPVAQLTELYQSARFGEHAAPIEQMSSLLRSIRDTLRSRKQ